MIQIFLFFCIAHNVFANIRLPDVISDSMVLQQNTSVRLWGWSAPAEKIYIITSWNNKTDIAPLTHFAIAGVIWYQGESNVLAASTYDNLFTSMIDAWRTARKKDLPFYYVQIAPFKYGNYNTAALLQEAQTKAAQHHNVGMAIITDLVDDTAAIHPQNRHGIGTRLADWALAETYHQPNIPHKNAVYKSMSIEKSKVIISFDNAAGGLQSKGEIRELSIAGADKIFHPAQGKIDKYKLIVWSKEVAQPVAVRYAFRNTAIGNLSGKDGLPVNAFRTDDWEVNTDLIK